MAPDEIDEDALVQAFAKAAAAARSLLELAEAWDEHAQAVHLHVGAETRRSLRETYAVNSARLTAP